MKKLGRITIPAGAHHTQPGQSLARTFGGNPPLRLVGEFQETIDINRVNNNAYHDPTHSPITDSANAVQIVVVNEDQIATRGPLRSPR